MTKCKKHPKYTGEHAPRTSCPDCMIIWSENHFPPKPNPKDELRRIRDSLEAMGIGTDDPVSGADAIDYLNALKERLDGYTG